MLIYNANFNNSVFKHFISVPPSSIFHPSSFTFTSIFHSSMIFLFENKIICAQRLRKRNKRRRGKKIQQNTFQKRNSHFVTFRLYSTPPKMLRRIISAPTNTQKLSECKALRGLENTSFSLTYEIYFSIILHSLGALPMMMEMKLNIHI